MTTDFISGLVSAKSLVNKIGCGLMVLAIVLCFFHLWWGIGALFVVGALVCGVNALCIVMPGNAGYQIVLGKLLNSPLDAGLRFVWPFITSVTEVDVRLQKHEDTNTMKTANLRDITLTYALTYQVDKRYVHFLHAAIGENEFVNKALCPWLDAVMTSIVASKTYEDINGKIADLSSEVKNAYLDEVEKQCKALTGKLPDHSDGINFFANISVAIIDVKFDEEYTQAVSKLAKTIKEKEIIEAQAEQLKISATAKADALRIEAEAEAAALKIKGDSENEIRKNLGKILKSHPELIKEELAKNFPKVFGGNSIINLDDILGK